MDSRKRVGIVTVTYNSAAVIGDFMMSITGQSYNEFILFVIDNASGDDTLRRLAEYNAEKVIVIPNQRNVGVAEGNNIGVRAALKAGCDLVLLINNDTVFGSDLLAKLTDGLEKYECQMIVPKILFSDEPETIWSAGGYFSAWRGAARHFGFRQKDCGQFDQPRIVDYNPTCCMLIKREVFDRVGFMDANYFVYFDDTDFCWRAHLAGIRLLYLPTARLIHKVNSLTGGESDFTFRFSTRNHVYYILKNFPLWMVLYYFPFYQAHIFVEYLVRRRRPSCYWMVQKAFWEGIELFASGTKGSRSGLGPTAIL